MLRFFTPYNELPNKDLHVYSLFPLGTNVRNVSYDLVMYDTYDYIDKLIGFKLSDIFYAAFMKYAEKYTDERARRLAKYIKYGTDSERSIWVLRYGMSFEDIDILDEHISSIDAEEIVFAKSIETVALDQRTSIERFLK